MPRQSPDHAETYPQVPDRQRCIHLGVLVDAPKATCRKTCWHACDEGHGVEGRARPAIECRTCDYHEVDEPGFFDPIGAEHSAEPVSEPVRQLPYSNTSLTFCHHGDQGDIVYSLRAVKQLCDEMGAKASLWCYTRLGTRVTMTERHAANLLPLLRVQPYLSSAGWSENARGVRLDAARRFAFKNPGAGQNIAEQYRLWLALPKAERSAAWLTVDRPDPIAPVVFSRTARYRPPSFPWKRIAERFKSQAVFIGSSDEYAAFRDEVSSDVPYYQTGNLLDVARVIAGCELFVGNQSCPRSIAEGLKVAVVVEESTAIADTRFVRPNAWYGKNESFWCSALDVNHARDQ